MVGACFSPGQIVCYGINLQVLTAGLVIVSVEGFSFTLLSSTASTPRPSAGVGAWGVGAEKVSAEFSLKLMDVAASNFSR